MSDVMSAFIDKKKAESPFISLEDGESVHISRLKDIRIVTKAGFGGDEKEVLRLACIVDTQEGVREKTFDNGTQRFAKEMQDKGIKIGSAFTITRRGTQTKTRYEISDVVAPAATSTPTPTPTATGNPVAPAPSTGGMASVGQIIGDKPKTDAPPF